MHREKKPIIAVSFESMEHNKTGSWRTFKPVLDETKCVKCYICWKFCPEASVEIIPNTGMVKINYDYCKGCGICANECPKEAIEMVEEK